MAKLLSTEVIYDRRAEAISKLLSKTAKKFVDIYHKYDSGHLLMTCEMDNKIDMEMLEGFGKELASRISIEISK